MANMRRLFLFSIVVALLTSFQPDNDIFVGEIHYINSFTSLSGEDITEKLAPYFGYEQHYFIDANNYKALDENNNWMQLYHNDDNIFNFFGKDKTIQKIDGSRLTSKKVIVTKLDIKETIAGYECNAIQIETDNEITIHFYSPSLKTDPKSFAKHNLGEWNKYLEATGGALSLKHIVTNYDDGYIWTSVATGINKMPLTAKDFEVPSGFTLKN
jgi:hypothetical protein